MAARRLFISDIHLSTKERYEAGDAWYNPTRHRTRLINFIENFVLARANQIKDVVLLGDIFDTWVCPPDEAPPTYSQMFADNGLEMKAFQDIVKNDIKLFYIHGNHDYDLNANELQTAIPGLRVIKSYLGAGRSHAEHGHRYTLFNEIDFHSDPAYGRPIGYYISRAVAKNPDVRSPDAILNYLDDIVEAAFTPQTLASSIVEAVTEHAGMTDGSDFLMPSGNRIKVSEVKERYATFTQRFNLMETSKRFYDELSGLGRSADNLCKQHSYNAVVFGHTHHGALDKDSWLTEPRIYANSGAWCQDENAHCVEIDKGPLTSKLTIRLHHIDDQGRVVRTDTEQLG